MKRLLIFAIILAMLVPTKVYATFDAEFWENQAREWEERNRDLQRDLAEVRNQLNDALTRPQPTPAPQSPNVRLVQPQSLVLTPGDVQYVNVVVRNIGNAMASNTLVTASTEGDFTIEFINNSNVIGNMSQNSDRTVRMRLTPDVNATAGNYSINLEFAFRNRDGVNETSTDTISVRIDARARQPQLMLRDFSTNVGRIMPGDSFTITANLLNLGEGSAYNVQAAIGEGLDPEGIFLSGSPNAPFLQTAAPDHRSTVSFAFTASDRISSGTFPIIFELTGRDHAGEDISERFTYFVTVVAPADGASRGFISISTTGPTGITGVNERANIGMTVTNTGSLTARNIRISATPANSSYIVPASASVQTIGALAPGASQNLNFVFSPTSEAESHYHMVGFEISYDTGIGDENDTFEQFVGINVYNPDRNGVSGSRPRVLVSAYSVEPRIVSAGAEFDLHLTFRNTHSTRSVYNLRVTIEAVEHDEDAGAVFTTVGTSNSLFIESLAPRQESSHTLRMFTVPTAEPRTYNLEVHFDYEDADFELLEETERLGINVQQVARLEIGNLILPDFAMAHQPVFADFNIINSGRVTLRNLRIEMHGNFDTSAMDFFVGDMGRGSHSSFSGHFIPMEAGEQHGTIIVSGEDEIGTLIEVRHEFTMFIDDMPMWEDDGMGEGGRLEEGMEEEGGFISRLPGSIWMWVVGGLVVIGAAAAGVIFYLKKKKNNRDIFADLQ